MNEYVQITGIAIVLFCLTMGFYSIQTKLTGSQKNIAKIAWYLISALIVSKAIW